jgi:hypothetical protein
MYQSNTKTSVKLSDVKLNLTKSQNLSLEQQQMVMGGCATCGCAVDLRRKG